MAGAKDEKMVVKMVVKMVGALAGLWVDRWAGYSVVLRVELMAVKMVDMKAAKMETMSERQ